MTRQKLALGEPPPSLAGFPRWTLTSSRNLFRAHTQGPWWFASSHGDDGDGRFDLSHPNGTCYLASTPAAAAREKWGATLVQRGFITASMAAATRVSSLTVPHNHSLANTTASRAVDFGATRELANMIPYDLTKRWAEAFHAARYAGVRYQARFSTGDREIAVALFGEAGTRTWATDPAPLTGERAAEQARIRVADVPTSVPTVAAGE